VSAEVADQVANFGANAGVWMLNQSVKVGIDVRVVDRLVEILRDPSKLGDERQRINYQVNLVFSRKQLELVDHCKSTALHKLLRKVL
jgi:hypothetical protein